MDVMSEIKHGIFRKNPAYTTGKHNFCTLQQFTSSVTQPNFLFFVIGTPLLLGTHAFQF